MQNLWKLNIDWDDPLSEESLTSWNEYKDHLSLLEDWSIPRLVKISRMMNYQLHGFADARQKAYHACIYIRSSDGD